MNGPAAHENVARLTLLHPLFPTCIALHFCCPHLLSRRGHALPPGLQAGHQVLHAGGHVGHQRVVRQQGGAGVHLGGDAGGSR